VQSANEVAPKYHGTPTAKLSQAVRSLASALKAPDPDVAGPITETTAIQGIPTSSMAVKTDFQSADEGITAAVISNKY